MILLESQEVASSSEYHMQQSQVSHQNNVFFKLQNSTFQSRYLTHQISHWLIITSIIWKKCVIHINKSVSYVQDLNNYYYYYSSDKDASDSRLDIYLTKSEFN